MESSSDCFPWSGAISGEDFLLLEPEDLLSLKLKWGKKRLFRDEAIETLEPYMKKVHKNSQTSTAIRKALVDLYNQIIHGDSNGITWSDLVTSLVESIQSSRTNQVDTPGNILPYKLKEVITDVNKTYGSKDTCYKLLYSQPGNLYISSQLNRLKVCDADSPTLHSLRIIQHSAPVVSCCEVGDYLLTSSCDLNMRLFEEGCRKEKEMIEVKCSRQTETQMCTSYSNYWQRLLTGSRTGILNIWNPLADNCESSIELVSHHRNHTQPILALKQIPHTSDKFLSASLDATVVQWNISRLSSPPIIYKGHEKGVYSIAYIDSYRMIASAGFEFIIRCWMEGQPLVRPFELKDLKNENAHKSGIVLVESVPGTPQVISCDSNGLAKIWDLRTMLPVQTFNICPEGYRSSSEISEVTSAVYLAHARQFLFCTSKNCYRFEYDGSAQVTEIGGTIEAEAKAAAARSDLNTARSEMTSRRQLLTYLIERDGDGSLRHNCMRVEVLKKERNCMQKLEQLTQIERKIADFGNPDVAHNPSATPLILCAYNKGHKGGGESGFFVTVASTEIKKQKQLWSAASGKVVYHMKELGVGQVTAASIDVVCGKNLVLGWSDGRVELMRTTNGSVVKKYKPPISADGVATPIWSGNDVTQTAIIPTQYLIVACGSRSPGAGAVAIWNSKLSDCRPPVKLIDFKSLIRVLHVSLDGGHIFIGDELGNTTYSVLSELMLSTVRSSTLAVCGPMPGEVCAVERLMPYPAFVCADASGVLNLVPMRPYPHRQFSLATWSCDISNNVVASASAAGVTALSWNYPFTLYGGDERGVIHQWDLSNLILGTKLSLFTTQGNPSHVNITPPSPQDVPPVKKSWKAHPGEGIKSLQVIGQYLLSSTVDCRVKIWKVTDGCTLVGALTNAPLREWKFHAPDPRTERVEKSTKPLLSPIIAHHASAIGRIAALGRFTTSALKSVIGTDVADEQDSSHPSESVYTELLQQWQVTEPVKGFEDASNKSDLHKRRNERRKSRRLALESNRSSIQSKVPDRSSFGSDYSVFDEIRPTANPDKERSSDFRRPSTRPTIDVRRETGESDQSVISTARQKCSQEGSLASPRHSPRMGNCSAEAKRLQNTEVCQRKSSPQMSPRGKFGNASPGSDCDRRSKSFDQSSPQVSPQVSPQMSPRGVLDPPVQDSQKGRNSGQNSPQISPRGRIENHPPLSPGTKQDHVRRKASHDQRRRGSGSKHLDSPPISPRGRIEANDDKNYDSLPASPHTQCSAHKEPISKHVAVFHTEDDDGDDDKIISANTTTVYVSDDLKLSPSRKTSIAESNVLSVNTPAYEPLTKVPKVIFTFNAFLESKEAFINIPTKLADLRPKHVVSMRTSLTNKVRVGTLSGNSNSKYTHSGNQSDDDVTSLIQLKNDFENINEEQSDNHDSSQQRGFIDCSESLDVVNEKKLSTEINNDSCVIDNSNEDITNTQPCNELEEDTNAINESTPFNTNNNDSDIKPLDNYSTSIKSDGGQSVSGKRIAANDKLQSCSRNDRRFVTSSDRRRDVLLNKQQLDLNMIRIGADTPLRCTQTTQRPRSAAIRRIPLCEDNLPTGVRDYINLNQQVATTTQRPKSAIHRQTRETISNPTAEQPAAGIDISQSDEKLLLKRSPISDCNNQIITPKVIEEEEVIPPLETKDLPAEFDNNTEPSIAVEDGLTNLSLSTTSKVSDGGCSQNKNFLHHRGWRRKADQLLSKNKTKQQKTATDTAAADVNSVVAKFNKRNARRRCEEIHSGGALLAGVCQASRHKRTSLKLQQHSLCDIALSCDVIRPRTGVIPQRMRRVKRGKTPLVK